ncbi:hypothetical protein C1645_818840 [Glomus cerebriforme]|uniref:Uncharacterized protein n=1 Tax=Glomus cerebriforme TaxID=658196 RepID=A0A397TC50_9GLOM|nr:hypothetical protein C1645_818840 [Glomus cerebriforme]
MGRLTAKEPSIILDNNDSKEVASNFDDNTSNLDDNIYLNDFEFEEISNNYIEDKVYNHLKLKIKEFFEKGKYENTRKANEDNRKFVHFNYRYNNNLLICRITYENLIGTSHKYLDKIIQHLLEYGIEEYVHGNTSRTQKI